MVMKRTFTGFGEVQLAEAAASLPFPPTQIGSVESWNLGNQTPGLLDIEIWADGLCTMTNARVYGLSLQQTEILLEPIDSVTFAADTLTKVAHGLQTGHGPIQLSTTGVLPVGLSLDTDYLVIRVDDNTLQLANSLEDAVEGVPVPFADAGTGTHSLEGSEDGDPDGNGVSWLRGSNNAYMPVWLQYGLLGVEGDGTIDVSSLEGYTTRILHRPRTVLYALVSDLSANTISASIYPVVRG